MNDFGPEDKRLEWVETKPTTSVAFLNLTSRITDSGEIATTTFQKAYNLYLYRPPTSAQLESIRYSLFYGTMHRGIIGKTLHWTFLPTTDQESTQVKGPRAALHKSSRGSQEV